MFEVIRYWRIASLARYRRIPVPKTRRESDVYQAVPASSRLESRFPGQCGLDASWGPVEQLVFRRTASVFPEHGGRAVRVRVMGRSQPRQTQLSAAVRTVCRRPGS